MMKLIQRILREVENSLIIMTAGDDAGGPNNRMAGISSFPDFGVIAYPEPMVTNKRNIRGDESILHHSGNCPIKSATGIPC
jgi:hypothetical protein